MTSKTLVIISIVCWSLSLISYLWVYRPWEKKEWIYEKEESNEGD